VIFSPSFSVFEAHFHVRRNISPSEGCPGVTNQAISELGLSLQNCPALTACQNSQIKKNSHSKTVRLKKNLLVNFGSCAIVAAGSVGRK